MPGKIVSTAQQSYLAINKPKVLHELSGGRVAKGLPYKVGSSRKSSDEEEDSKKRLRRMTTTKAALGG